jgi:hypothetical protein
MPKSSLGRLRRKRKTPLTTSAVRGLARRRGYLLAIEARSPRLFKLVSFVGKTALMPSKDAKHRYAWKLADADAWLREQPLLSDQ